MSPRQNRPRRAVSRHTLAVLRLAGWRYSSTREAYVHRWGKGKVGPVFVEAARPYGAPAVLDTTIWDALVARRGEPAAQWSPVSPTPLPARSPREAPARTPVEVRFHDSEEPLVVHVDGRPPVLDLDHRGLRQAYA